MFDIMEFIKAVPSRQGRPGVGERFEPYVRIVENERWISVFHGAERIAKIAISSDEAGKHTALEEAAAIRNKIIADFHTAVSEHNIMVTGRKLEDQRALTFRLFQQAEALNREYGAVTHPPAPAAEAAVVETVTEDAPPPVVETPAPVAETVAEEAPAPTATQIDAPKVAARSVTRRPVRKPATAKAKAVKTAAKRNGK